MITLRKAVAIAATSALALVGAASTATAQTAQSTLTVNVKTSGPAPATITGYTVTTTCRLLAGSLATQDAVSVFPVTGGSLPQVFSLTASSNCSVKVTASGSNGAAGQVTISIGGTVRASGALGSALTVDQGAANSTAVTGPTTIDIVIAYPSLTVKKVVLGEEIVPGTEYSMVAVCVYNDAAATPAGSFAFKLKAGASKVITNADIPGLLAGATCHVAETSTGGSASTTYGSTNSTDATIAPGISLTSDTTAYTPFTANGVCPTKFADGKCATVYTFASAGTKADGQTITVTNSFVGDLIVSKVVVGDPKSNIAVYEVSVSCNNNGPRETFLLKDRQSKVFTGIVSGTSCLVSESRSDGATASYADNSGDNATDGRVTIKGTASGCIDTRLSSFPDCRANVIITNSYVPATTTAAPTTAAPATQAPATAAPVAPAPVEEPAVLDDTEVVTG